MSSIKKTIYIISAGCLIFMFVFYKLFIDNRKEVCLFMGILFMTAAYHLITRLVIGTFGDAALEKGIDTENHWFAESDTEQSVYRAIGVKSWMNKLPAPEPWKFSVKRRSLEDIIAESCRTEVVHEAGVCASLLTILFSIPFGYLWFFILTAVVGSVFDMVFIIIQRYNRPRLARTAAKKRMLFFEKLEYDNAFAEYEAVENESTGNDSVDSEAVENENAGNDSAEYEAVENESADNDAADNEASDNEAEPNDFVRDTEYSEEGHIIPEDSEEDDK